MTGILKAPQSCQNRATMSEPSRVALCCGGAARPSDGQQPFKRDFGIHPAQGSADAGSFRLVGNVSAPGRICPSRGGPCFDRRDELTDPHCYPFLPEAEAMRDRSGEMDPRLSTRRKTAMSRSRLRSGHRYFVASLVLIALLGSMCNSGSEGSPTGGATVSAVVAVAVGGQGSGALDETETPITARLVAERAPQIPERIPFLPADSEFTPTGVPIVRDDARPRDFGYEWLTNFGIRIAHFDEFLPRLLRDQIPALTDPSFISVVEADEIYTWRVADGLRRR